MTTSIASVMEPTSIKDHGTSKSNKYGKFTKVDIFSDVEEMNVRTRWNQPWRMNSKLIIFTMVFSAIIFVMLLLKLFLLAQSHSSGTIILFGDSLISHFDSHIGRTVHKNLAKSNTGVYVYSSGVGGSRILNLKDRMYDDIIHRPAFGFLTFWRLPPPDAVIMYWDSDAVDAEDALDLNVIDLYKQNLRIVLSTLNENIKFIAVGGPTLDGELPRGQNPKDYTLDLYTDINRNITKEYDITYLETREYFFSNLPSSWKNTKGYLTSDGEHQNYRGSDLLVELFTATLQKWLNTNPL